jgi:hypothetical protein
MKQHMHFHLMFEDRLRPSTLEYNSSIWQIRIYKNSSIIRFIAKQRTKWDPVASSRKKEMENTFEQIHEIKVRIYKIGPIKHTAK